MRYWASIILAATLAFGTASVAAETPIPAAPKAWVTDTANFMSPQAAALLNARLRAYQERNQHQLIVWIGDTLDGVEIEDWAVRAFEAWKPGRKGVDDGLILFIFAKDRKLRFEVGYELESSVPDVTASRVINEIIVPKIRAGDSDGAVTAGMEAIAAAIGGPPLPGARVATPGERQSGRRPLTLGQMLLYGIGGIFVLIILIKNPWLALLLLSSQSGGRGGGFGGGGGGGFGGGGGRSGGGGASGSW